MDTDENNTQVPATTIPPIDSPDQPEQQNKTEIDAATAFAPEPQMEAAPTVPELMSQAEDLAQPEHPETIPYTNTSSVQEPTPQDPTTAQAPEISKKKKFPTKLLIIIGAALLLLGGIGVALWIFVFSGMPLTKYSNNDYSIMVPTSYYKMENEGNVNFSKSKPIPDKGQSDITIYVTPINSETVSASREESIKSIDGLLDDSIAESKSKDKSSSGAKEEISSVKSEKNSVNSWTVTKNYIVLDKVVGKQILAMYLSDSKMVGVEMNIYSADTDLAAAKSKILNSLVIK